MNRIIYEITFNTSDLVTKRSVKGGTKIENLRLIYRYEIKNDKGDTYMNKKILLLLMAGVLSTSSIVAFAEETEKTDDVMPISVEEKVEANEFTGVVKSIDEDNIVIEVETEDSKVEVSFVITENTVKEDVKAEDVVTITSTSELFTKDIKEALSINKAEKVEEEVVEETKDIINNYMGTVKAVGEGNITVAVVTESGETDVNFVITENTAVCNNNGETVELKVDDNVTVASTSELLTKDIKEAKAVVLNDAEKVTTVFIDTFNKSELGFISADGELVLNIEDDKIAEYDGKELMVIYEFATMSLPAQTNPTAVVVLNEKEAEKSVEISFKVGDSILKINGSDVEVETPYIAGDGTTLVPLRVISEAFGAEVNWDGETKTVTIVYNEKTVKVQIDSKKAVVSEANDSSVAGVETELEEAPQLTENGVTMVPLRFISESLGAEVGYDNATQGITVSL